MKNLVIVESPAKAKTIESYLGKGFKVMSSVGHIRDLPKSELGVDTDKGYSPKYITVKGKGGVVSKLKKAVPVEGVVYLAQDLDREGEAIAWHVGQSLGLFDESGKPKKVRGKSVEYKRIVFNEITKEAINNAIKKPRKINMDLINAQQARRVLDRLVGYKLSPLLWKKIRYGLSAGRVQSVSVRLIVDREREREAFKPEEYWSINAFLYKKSKKESNPFELLKYKGKKFQVGSSKDAENIVDKLSKDGKWTVTNIERSVKKKNPSAPFTTSTLQQRAYNKYKFTSKKTMGIAQKLYQGVDAGKHGTKALITYMRTDSTNISHQALTSIRKHIEEKIGKDLLEEKPREYKKKVKSAQEAHEAIRPTDISITPLEAKRFLDKDELKLYELIWKRTVATQMISAEYENLRVDVDCKEYTFRNSNQILKKSGFLKIYSKNPENSVETDLEEGDILKLDKFEKDQHFTQPPARYNEASLVKDLEKHGIGRPSTYSSIISTVQRRGYVSKVGGYFKPEDTGFVVTDLLVKHFPSIVDLDFTSKMEDDLDEIANGKIKWVPVVDEFYKPFVAKLEEKEKSIDKEDIVVLGDSDEKCDLCDKKMIIKLGRYGRFLSCSDFPNCKGMKSILEDNQEELQEKYEIPEKCPACGSGMSLKMGRYGRFWACDTYPDCKGVSPMMLKEKCPQCGKSLVERKGKWGKTFVGCTGYPECRYIKKNEKKDTET